MRTIKRTLHNTIIHTVCITFKREKYYVDNSISYRNEIRLRSNYVRYEQVSYIRRLIDSLCDCI
jgi:hypothetical protein